MYYRDSYKKDIDVTSNDPNKASFILTIVATIRENLSINPQYIDFGAIPAGATNNRPIKITNKGKSNVTIMLLEANPAANLNISPNKNIVIKPGYTKEFMLKLNTGKDAGFIDGSILIKTNLPNFPDKTIPVRAEIIPR